MKPRKSFAQIAYEVDSFNQPWCLPWAALSAETRKAYYALAQAVGRAVKRRGKHPHLRPLK